VGRDFAQRLPSIVDDAEVNEEAVEFQRIVKGGGGSSRQRANAPCSVFRDGEALGLGRSCGSNFGSYSL
jgi:hypothetical protein